MEYRLGVTGGPETVDGGTAVLLLHPSTAETDRIDTQFLAGDDESYLVISTRTTAREVEQKLEFYDIDEQDVTILDTISVERGYSRRKSDDVSYLPAPDDIEGLLSVVETFLTDTDGPRRISLDSITELAYYAGDSSAKYAVESLIELLEAEDAIGIFHLASGVHDEDVIDTYRSLFDLVIELDDDDTVTVTS